MLTPGQARTIASTLMRRRGETAIAAAMLNAQLAQRTGDVAREDDWRLIAQLMDWMRPARSPSCVLTRGPGS